MKTVRRAKSGIDYIGGVLASSKQRITRAVFWKIPHKTKDDEINLKIGRYLRTEFDLDTLECGDPKSELTLKDAEFHALIKFIAENYEPFKSGVKQYIPVDERFSNENIDQLRSIFNNPDRGKLIEFLDRNNVLPSDVVEGLEFARRREAISRFEEMLSMDLVEGEWQKWFKDNSWVLGSDFVDILDSRTIDVENIADYLVKAYDGFLDVIEIKRPGGDLKFWASSLDHGNYVPSTDLVKAITQASSYVFEIEREVNSQKFLERMSGTQAIKPRCTLVFGRSHEWNEHQRRSFRIFNSSFHNISIMTYDHVLRRAKKMLELSKNDPAD